jgi:hypothetical protein
VVLVHVEDLVGDGDHRLVLLHLEFADHEVYERGDFQGMELVPLSFPLLSGLVFSVEVVRHISKAEPSVDLLIKFGSFSEVGSLEEGCCFLLVVKYDI